MKEETSTGSYSESKTISPLVSVVLPIKNANQTIDRAIGSILNQTYSKLELIIINDHSTDDSLDTVNRYKDKRIKLVENNGSGIAMALNTGLLHAAGEYIARMDADDFSHTDRIQMQVDLLESKPDIGVVSCLVNHIGDQESQIGYRLHVEWMNRIIESYHHYINRFIDATVAHPSVMFRRALIDRFGDYSTNPLPEDFELWLRWMQNGVRFEKVPHTLFDWYDLPGRASRESENYSQEAFFKTKANYFSNWWKKKKHNKELWICGYGKDVFRKSKHLIDYDINITGYIDLYERKSSTRIVRTYQKIPAINGFFLVYVSDRTGKELVKEYLENQNMEAGKDFLLMS